jgi:hypothetical protein
VVIDSNASSAASSSEVKSANRLKHDTTTISKAPPSSPPTPGAAKEITLLTSTDHSGSSSKSAPLSSTPSASSTDDVESRKRGLESSEDGSRGKVDEMNGKLMKGERHWVFLFLNTSIFILVHACYLVVIDSSASSALSDLQLSSSNEVSLTNPSASSSSSSSKLPSANPNKERLNLVQPGSDDVDSRKRTFGSDAPTSTCEVEDHDAAAGKQKRGMFMLIGLFRS